MVTWCDCPAHQQPWWLDYSTSVGGNNGLIDGSCNWIFFSQEVYQQRQQRVYIRWTRRSLESQFLMLARCDCLPNSHGDYSTQLFEERPLDQTKVWGLGEPTRDISSKENAPNIKGQSMFLFDDQKYVRATKTTQPRQSQPMFIWLITPCNG